MQSFEGSIVRYPLRMNGLNWRYVGAWVSESKINLFSSFSALSNLHHRNLKAVWTFGSSPAVPSLAPPSPSLAPPQLDYHIFLCNCYYCYYNSYACLKWSAKKSEKFLLFHTFQEQRKSVSSNMVRDDRQGRQTLVISTFSVHHTALTSNNKRNGSFFLTFYGSLNDLTMLQEEESTMMMRQRPMRCINKKRANLIFMEIRNSSNNFFLIPNLHHHWWTLRKIKTNKRSQRRFFKYFLKSLLNDALSGNLILSLSFIRKRFLKNFVFIVSANSKILYASAALLLLQGRKTATLVEILSSSNAQGRRETCKS